MAEQRTVADQRRKAHPGLAAPDLAVGTGGRLKRGSTDRTLLGLGGKNHSTFSNLSGLHSLRLLESRDHFPWCNGNTTASGAVVLGSSPGGKARIP